MQWYRAKELERERKQGEYDANMDSAERNRFGQFPTSFPLAKQIVKIALHYSEKNSAETRFLEPALGSGSFYSALLDVTGGTCPECAMGYEVDEQLGKLAKELWSDKGLEVKIQDFTRAKAPKSEQKKFTLLATNPPYVRHHHLSKCQKERLANMVKKQLDFGTNGLMGLYGYFLFLANHWVQKGGIQAWLIPSEFMDVGYGRTIKKYLTEKVSLLRVHRFRADDSQFTEADVTSSVIFFRNNPPSDEDEVMFSVGSGLVKPEFECNLRIKKLKQIQKWTKVSNESWEQEHAKHNSESSLTIGELFKVKRGLVTGANGFFILNREEAKERDLPECFLKPILPSPRHLRGIDVIESDKEGFPDVEPQLVLLDCDISRAIVEKQYPPLHQYLCEGEEQGLPNRYLLSRRDPWYAQEKREPTPIVCGYMGRKTKDGKSIRFYRNESEAVAANVYLMLYPRTDVFGPRDNWSEKVFDEVFETLISLKQRSITYHGRTYGGGLDKVEPKELQNVSIPDVSIMLDAHDVSFSRHSQTRMF